MFVLPTSTCTGKYYLQNSRCNNHSQEKCFILLVPGFPEFGSPANSPFRNTAEYRVVNATVKETQHQNQANLQQTYRLTISTGYLPPLFKEMVPTVCVTEILVMPFPLQ